MALGLVRDHGLSALQASRATGVARSTIVYVPRQRGDGPWRELLAGLVAAHPGIGFWKSFRRLRLRGHAVNHKRLYRIYTDMGLNVRARKHKRLPERAKGRLCAPAAPDAVWSMDFMADSLWDGRRFRVLNVVDDFNRQTLWVEEGASLPAARVVRAHGVELVCIQPGKPTQNAYVERFNRTLRGEVLDAHAFRTMEEVRQRLDSFVFDYNHLRPHEGLQNMTPIQLLQKHESSILQLQ